MRIIQIIDVRWYNATAHFAIVQARALADNGHAVLLLANPGSPPAAKAKEMGLDVKETINFSGKNILRISSRLAAEAKAFNADIIFAHRGESHLAAALASRKTGIPAVRFRGDVRAPRKGFFSKILNEKMTSGIAVSTEKLQSEYKERYRLNGIPMAVIYPAIESAEFHINRPKSELRTSFGLHPDKYTVGIVGRFSPVKGHAYFIEAAARVEKSYPDVQFVIAGGDAQMSASDMEEKARQAGLRNCHVFGLVENISELVNTFDIGVVASTGSEMICRVLLEYFAAGVAAVATDINQVGEIMSVSRGGILVPPKDSPAMADAIIALIDDHERRTVCGESGRVWVENTRTLRDLSSDTENFLRRVINV